MPENDNSENEDSLLTKRISRKQFVKISALGLMGVAGAYLLKDIPVGVRDKKNSYGNGRYGGC